jgi:hypothetical protein
LQERAAAFGQLQPLAPLEGVVVGDQDLRPLQVRYHVARDDLATRVVAVRIVWLEYPQAVTNRYTRGDDQETAGELFAVGSAHRIDGLPGNEHRHDRGLARTGGQLQRQTQQLRVRILVGIGEVLDEDLAGLTYLGGYLGQPDSGFDRLHLAKEGTDAVELVVPPMPEQAGGLGSNQPIVGIRQFAPLIHMATELVDDGSGVVLLLFRR